MDCDCMKIHEQKEHRLDPDPGKWYCHGTKVALHSLWQRSYTGTQTGSYYLYSFLAI